MSKCFEDFVVGEESVSAGRTVTEADIVNFAGLSGDFNELHTNAEYAGKGPFGQRIAHGALVFSIASGLAVRMGTLDRSVIAYYGIDKLRFIKPTFIGDTLELHIRVAGKEDRDATSGILIIEAKVMNQRGETVVAYTDRVLVKKKGIASSALPRREKRRGRRRT